MYSTSFHSSFRYVVVCLAVHRAVKAVETIVDTGAVYTCYMAHSIDPDLAESDLQENTHKDFGGFVDGNSRVVRFYQYQLKQFTIGNIDMGPQSIWVTFDKNHRKARMIKEQVLVSRFAGASASRVWPRCYRRSYRCETLSRQNSHSKSFHGKSSLRCG